MLQSIGSQRVLCDWLAELSWKLNQYSLSFKGVGYIQLWVLVFKMRYGLHIANAWKRINLELFESFLFHNLSEPVPEISHETAHGIRLHEVWVGRTNNPDTEIWAVSLVSYILHFRLLIPRILLLLQGGNVTFKSGFRCWSNAGVHALNGFLLICVI